MCYQRKWLGRMVAENNRLSLSSSLSLSCLVCSFVNQFMTSDDHLEKSCVESVVVAMLAVLGLISHALKIQVIRQHVISSFYAFSYPFLS